MRKALLVVAMAALLVTAGCSGLSGDQSPTPTETPTPEPTPTATPEPTYPDGASASGIDNANALNRSTQAAVEAADSYRVTYEITRESDGETETNGSIVVEASADGELTRFDSNNAKYTVWEDGEYFGLKSVADDQTQFLYSKGGSLLTSVFTNYDRLIIQQATTAQMRAFEFEMTGTTERDGTRLLVYESTGVNESFVEENDNFEATSGDLTAYVSEDGVVHELSGTVVADNGSTTTEFTYKLDGIGETESSAPDWYDERLPQLQGDLQADGSLMVVNHTGGSTVPAGSQMTVTLGSNRGAIETDTAIEPGDTVYIYATQNETTGQAEVQLSVNERPDMADAVEVERAQGALELRLDDGEVSVRLAFTPDQE